MISALSSTNILKNQLFRISLTDQQILIIQSVAIAIFGVIASLYSLYIFYGNWRIIKKDIRVNNLLSQKEIYRKSKNEKEYFNCLKEIETFDSITRGELADCYFNGVGVNQDKLKAFQLYEQIVRERPTSYSERMLGFCYRDGTGVTKNESKAFELFKKAAEKGDSYAKVALGCCYQLGTGVELDLNQAFQWYEQSSMEGDFVGKLYLARCYLNGWGVAQNVERGSQLYKEISDSPFSQYLTSEEVAHVLHYLGIRSLKDIGIARDLTPIEEAKILYYLGMKYLAGTIHVLNGPRIHQDTSIGWQLIKQAAKLGFLDAQLELAAWYRAGAYVKKDLKKAFKWYSLAAENGSPSAKAALKRRPFV